IASLLPMVNTLREDDPNLIFSYGDTPSASTAVSFPGINELRPGNFVFYDLTQTIIGSCTLQDVAIVMACPVVSKQPERQEVILYGGGIHFSKDRVPYQDKLVFGLPVRWTASGWTVIDDGQSYMKKVSQEHGVLRLAQDWFDQINIGDIVGVIPVHSCMAADLMKQYRSLDDHSLISMMTYV
ncbi:MAG: alanine racemase, partial [Saprospiraceae bacterium]|nr:alanine racemase [Saprospiraceae bacterium]